MPAVDRAADGYRLTKLVDHVHVAIRGRPRLEMVVSMFDELEQLTTADGDLLVLIDESEMKAALLSPHELRAMIDALKASAGLRHRSRIAVNAPSNVVYGVNRMAQAFAGEKSVGRLEVFRNEAAALAWLLGEHER